MSIDWTKADDREWMYERFLEGKWHDVTRGPAANDASSRHSVVDTLTEIDAHEIVTLHAYRLAQERRPEWAIADYIGNVVGSLTLGWRVWDQSASKYKTEKLPSLLAAMAEFVRLDREMPR